MEPVEYRVNSSDGLTVYADLSLPAGKGPYPLLVVLRGAAGGALDEQGEYTHLEEHKALLSNSLAICTVSHRGTPGRGEEFASMHDLGGPHIDDVIAVVSELADHENIDPEKIVLLGTSRGAFMAALCVGQQDLFAGAILVNGYYNLRDWFEFQEKHFGEDSPLAQIIRPSWQALWNDFPIDERSPDGYAENIQCPLLLIHGAADRHVPAEQSKSFHDYLQSIGKTSELVLIESMGHSYPEEDAESWQQVWQLSRAFLAGLGIKSG